MLEKDPARRATLKDILKHEWVTNKGEENIEVEQVENFNNGDLGNVSRLVKLKKMG
tara:strand:- start:26 stop:193 length:168 start_codon:yes stop_codon:yes gene_type:complete